MHIVWHKNAYTNLNLIHCTKTKNSQQIECYFDKNLMPFPLLHQWKSTQKYCSGKTHTAHFILNMLQKPKEKIEKVFQSQTEKAFDSLFMIYKTCNA